MFTPLFLSGHNSGCKNTTPDSESQLRMLQIVAPPEGLQQSAEEARRRGDPLAVACGHRHDLHVRGQRVGQRLQGLPRFRLVHLNRGTGRGIRSTAPHGPEATGAAQTNLVGNNHAGPLEQRDVEGSQLLPKKMVGVQRWYRARVAANRLAAVRKQQHESNNRREEGTKEKRARHSREGESGYARAAAATEK